MWHRYLLLFLFFATLPLLYSFSEEVASENHPELIASLPAAINESSGLENADKPDHFWTLNDSNGGAVLYKINDIGELLQIEMVPTAENVDWEDLAQDPNGNLYIADVGNNHSRRQNLCIYKYKPGSDEAPEPIFFNYQDQKEFILPNEKQVYDCEAVFWHNQQLYLITKDRLNGRSTRLYCLPDRPGDFTAQLVDSLHFPAQVTAADISPDKHRIALLCKDELLIFYRNDVATDRFFGAEPKRIPLANTGKTEAVVFSDNETVIFSNEQGKLYRCSI